MKKTLAILTLLMAFILVLAVPVVALAASEDVPILAGLNWAIVLSVALGVAVVIFGFLVSYFKTSSTFRSFIVQLITDAEVKYANIEKAGQQKMAYVIDKLYEIIPLPLKLTFTKARLEAFAQEVFDWVKQFAIIQCDKAVAALQAKYNAAKKKTTS